MRLADRVVIVTGGAQGIGRAIAERLHEEGATVVVADLQGAEDAAAELGGIGHARWMSPRRPIPRPWPPRRSSATAASTPRQQRRHLQLARAQAVRGDRRRRVAQGLRRQRARHVPRHPRGRARHARRGVRANRQHRLGHALQGRAVPAPLRHQQGRRDRDDARDRQGGGRGRHPRQHRGARLHDVGRRARQPGAGRAAAGDLAQGPARCSATSTRATSSAPSRSSARRTPTSSPANRSWSTEGRTSTDGYLSAGRRAPRRGRAAPGDARSLRRPRQHGELQQRGGVRRGLRPPRLRADHGRTSPQLRAGRRAGPGRADGARARPAGRRVPPALRPRRLPARRRGVPAHPPGPGHPRAAVRLDPHRDAGRDARVRAGRAVVRDRARSGVRRDASRTSRARSCAAWCCRARSRARHRSATCATRTASARSRSATRCSWTSRSSCERPGAAGSCSPTSSHCTTSSLRSACPARATWRCWTASTRTATALRVITCRHEAAAANAADAYGKLTGRPGVCMVTRGPGATHAATGVHTAMQDSTPLVLLVGQVPREHRGREAFQEIDYEPMFGRIAKWVFEIDQPERIPELVARAFATAVAGRPGPVVLALPEDVLSAHDRRPGRRARARAWPRRRRPPTSRACASCWRAAERPLAIVGGGGWTPRGRGRPRRVPGRRRHSGRRPRSAARTSSTTGCRSTAAISAWASTRRSRSACARPTSCSRSARGCRRPRPAATRTSRRPMPAQTLVHVHQDAAELGPRLPPGGRHRLGAAGVRGRGARARAVRRQPLRGLARGRSRRLRGHAELRAGARKRRRHGRRARAAARAAARRDRRQRRRQLHGLGPSLLAVLPLPLAARAALGRDGLRRAGRARRQARAPRAAGRGVRRRRLLPDVRAGARDDGRQRPRRSS